MWSGRHEPATAPQHWRVVHGVERASKRMAASKGITGPQRLVLRIVGLHPGTIADHVDA